MNLRQLLYIREVAHRNLNVSATAMSLHTSQPGVSKQIRLLEGELGTNIFVRSGKHLTSVTPAGKKIIEIAEDILCKTHSIRQVARDSSNENCGPLSVSCTRLQARHTLPPVVKTFMQNFPAVSLRIRQGESRQTAEMLMEGEVDIAVCTEPMNSLSWLLTLPCYRYSTGLVVPHDHPLTQAQTADLTLHDLASFPAIVCSSGPASYSRLQDTCVREGIVLTAACQVEDTDLVKAYVRMGMGVGIVPNLAWDPRQDSDLAYVDTAHLFPLGTVYLGLRRGVFLRSFVYDFIALLASHLTRDLVDEALAMQSCSSIENLLSDISLPACPVGQSSLCQENAAM